MMQPMHGPQRMAGKEEKKGRRNDVVILRSVPAHRRRIWRQGFPLDAGGGCGRGGRACDRSPRTLPAGPQRRHAHQWRCPEITLFHLIFFLHLCIIFSFLFLARAAKAQREQGIYAPLEEFSVVSILSIRVGNLFLSFTNSFKKIFHLDPL